MYNANVLQHCEKTILKYFRIKPSASHIDTEMRIPASLIILQYLNE